MPRLFLEYLSSKKLYQCKKCHSHFVDRKDLVSKNFQGRTGKAFLLRNVVNVICGPEQDKQMMSGLHRVKSISCKGCLECIGWTYVKAFEASQKYKEGLFIIERAFMVKNSTVMRRENQSARRRQRSRSNPPATSITANRDPNGPSQVAGDNNRNSEHASGNQDQIILDSGDDNDFLEAEQLQDEHITAMRQVQQIIDTVNRQNLIQLDRSDHDEQDAMNGLNIEALMFQDSEMAGGDQNQGDTFQVQTNSLGIDPPLSSVPSSQRVVEEAANVVQSSMSSQQSQNRNNSRRRSARLYRSGISSSSQIIR